MKNIVFLSLVLLVSVGTMAAMQQPLKDFTGQVKSIVCKPGSVIATLPDGKQIALDPSIQWNTGPNNMVFPMNKRQAQVPAAPIATPKAPAAPAPKAPAIQTIPKAAAANVVAQRAADCAGGRCPKAQRTVIVRMVYSGGKCDRKQPAVIKPAGGCKGGRCSMIRK